jgi:hypothetical protein
MNRWDKCLLPAVVFVLAILYILTTENLVERVERAGIPISQISGSLQGKTLAEDPEYSLEYAYSLWLRPTRGVGQTFADEIKHLGTLFNGTLNHPPHVTLCGGIFTTNETFVVSRARDISKTIPPILLNYSRIEVQKFNPTARWRGGVLVCYKRDKHIMSAMELAYRSLSPYADQPQKPHLTLLYDYDGGSYRDFLIHRNNTANKATSPPWPLKKPVSFTWVATEVEIWFTPVRKHFKSAEDMRNIVALWKKIATFKLEGSQPLLKRSFRV